MRYLEVDATGRIVGPLAGIEEDPGQRYATVAEFRQALAALDLAAEGPKSNTPLWMKVVLTIGGLMFLTMVVVLTITFATYRAPEPTEQPRDTPTLQRRSAVGGTTATGGAAGGRTVPDAR